MAERIIIFSGKQYSGKDDRASERIPPDTAFVPQAGHYACLFARAGRHTRHYGRAGAP